MQIFKCFSCVHVMIKVKDVIVAFPNMDNMMVTSKENTSDFCSVICF